MPQFGSTSICLYAIIIHVVRSVDWDCFITLVLIVDIKCGVMLHEAYSIFAASAIIIHVVRSVDWDCFITLVLIVDIKCGVMLHEAYSIFAASAQDLFVLALIAHTVFCGCTRMYMYLVQYYSLNLTCTDSGHAY